MSDSMRNIPSVDQVLNHPSTDRLLARYRRDWIAGQVREVLEDLRRKVREGREKGERGHLLEQAAAGLVNRVEQEAAPSLKRVVNATGIVLHTGLGRAPLPPAALEAVQRAADNYCALEYDLAKGKRGFRLDHVESLIREATGAEAAAVVNNNAAAVLLMLNTLARGKEVVVSRGQLVEIGGSFRMPDVIEASGARIREVGTTNRTHLRDYVEAVGPRTGAILMVHPSNYRVKGFTSEVGLKELVDLGRKADLPVLYDLGGGALVDLEEWGLPHEPVVSDSLKAGADLVSFSGDKVLGGPQSGIIAGHRKYVERIVRNPLMRPLRCDKLILSALEATLRLYRLDRQAFRAAHPALRMLAAPVEEVEQRARKLLEMLSGETIERLQPEIVFTRTQAGSGTLPLEELPSCAVALSPRHCSAEELARRLRTGEKSVVGRLRGDRLLLDLRTVRDDELEWIVQALDEAAGLRS